MVPPTGLGAWPAACRLEGVSMRQCPNCGFQSEGGLSCQLCGHRLPILWGINDLTVRRIGITLLVPVLIWILMTRVLGV